MKQLQAKHKLLQLRDEFGVMSADPEVISREIWQTTMLVQGPPPSACKSFLAKFFFLHFLSVYFFSTFVHL